jgi:prephenate dehydrogenase
MQRIAIFGVGLIGGSFALALRAAGFRGEIAGVSSPNTIAKALSLGVIDRSLDGEAAIRESDVIYLAQPVCTIIATLEKLGPVIPAHVLVTDAGSTKLQIMETARRSVTKALFVGGHPMAGKERSGVNEADAELFHNRKYVLTPHSTQHVTDERYITFRYWIERIGAQPVVLDAAEHDRLVAFTSHMPQLLSTALASVLAEVPEANVVAGPAVRELTRIAASSFDVWRDILSTNKGPVEEALRAVTVKLNYLLGQLGSDALAEEFSKGADVARALRQDS